MPTCRRCNGEVVQKSRLRLVSVGIAMLAAAASAIWWPILVVPAVLLVMIGSYLIVWAVGGRGRWCRGCKRFDGV